MARFQIRDDNRSLAFYDAEDAESALSAYAADKAEAARKLALGVAMSEMTVFDGIATTVINGRRHTARAA